VGPTDLTDRQRATLVPPTLAAGWLVVALAALLVLADLSLPPLVRYAPLVVSAVVFGMPHGAVDPVALPRALGESPTRRWLAVVGTLYLVLGGAYAVAWFVVPVPAALAFLALTWLHWGQGDLYALLEFVGVDYLDTPARRSLAVLVRGGLPILVPLLAAPDRYRAVVEAFATPFGGSIGAALLDPGVRLAAGAGFAGLTGVALLAGRLRTRRVTAWRIDAAETLGLWVYFALVPPVFAVGVYFVCWHSVRHVARAIALDPEARPSLEAGDLFGPLSGFAREAAPLTGGALALCAVLPAVVPDPPTTLAGGATLYLVFVAVLTLPHVAVVSWMDRAQGGLRVGP
jgi:Brp/Blh family beta-carotene 15,15'-monooxygenase